MGHERDGAYEPDGIDRLGHVQLKAGLQRTLAILQTSVGRERDGGNLCVGATGAHRLQQDVAVGAGHADVAHQHVHRAAIQRGERLVGRGREADPGPGLLEGQPREIARVLLVVDDQHVQPRQVARRVGDVGRGIERDRAFARLR